MRFLREKLKLPLLQHAKLVSISLQIRKKGNIKKCTLFSSTISKERRGKTQISGGGWLPPVLYTVVYRALFLLHTHPKNSSQNFKPIFK